MPARSDDDTAAGATVDAPSCPPVALLQSPWLALAALGDNTRAHPDDRGNHLRWAFDPTLGFPPGGFDLYRREHVEPRPSCFGVARSLSPRQDLGSEVVLGGFRLEAATSIRTDDLIGSPGSPHGQAEIDLRRHEELTLRPLELCRHVRITVAPLPSLAPAPPSDPGSIVGRPAGIEAVAFDRGRAVISKQVPGGARTGEAVHLDLEADRIDRVVLRPALSWGAAIHGVLLGWCWTPLLQDACEGTWRRLNRRRIYLPLSNSAYPPHGEARPDLDALAGRGREWDFACVRIRSRHWAQYCPPAFTGLHDTLSRVYDATLQPPPTEDESCPVDGEPPDPLDLTDDPLGTVLLTSLDPNIARLLGLYWIDGAFYAKGLQKAAPALVGQRYDYFLVGHYQPVVARASVADDFDADPLGLAISGWVDRHGLRYESFGRLTVVAHPLGHVDPPSRQALLFEGDQTLSIALNRFATAVELYVDLAGAEVTSVRALSGGLEVARRQSWEGDPTSPALPTLRRYLLVAEAFDRVELAGRGLRLVRVCVHTGAYLPGGRLGWITFGVALGRPASLAVPALVTGVPLPVTPYPAESASGSCVSTAAQMAVGLNWQRPSSPEGLLPRSAVVYDVERQGLGTGPAPAGIRPHRACWQPVRRQLLVAPPPEDCEPYAPLSGWPSFRPDVIDVPSATPRHRWYAYRVRGRDLFGRQSGDRESAPIDLKDSVAPPPPADIVARYLDPEDPFLLADERAWTHAPGVAPRHGLRVGWRWPSNRAEQAPDAAEFRVFLRHGHLQAVVGNVTAVGPERSDHRLDLDTDVEVASLPGGDLPGAFRSEWLSQGAQLYRVVDSASASGRLLVTVERLMWDPPAAVASDPQAVVAELQPIPARGPFSLSIGPAQAFAGTLTVKGGVVSTLGPPDAERVVTVETDVAFRGRPEGLVGLKLRQGGATWTVVGANAGWPCLLVLARRTCPPREPTPGAGFLLLELDGQTPHLLSPANPHWRDYGAARNWDRLLHVEPLRQGAEEYSVVVPFPAPLPIPAGAGVGWGAVGVATADSEQGVAVAGRPGNEGPVSPPVVVARSDRRAPPAVSAGTSNLTSTPADFFGRSFFTVRWLPAAGAGLRYQVARALAPRPAKPGDPAPVPAAERYFLLTPEPLRAEDLADFAEPGHAADPALLAYRDTLDGRTSSQFWYQVRALSPAGVPGPWSDPVGPVRCPDVVPPRAPVITEIRGGDREILLRWAPNREADLKEYLVYRAESEEAAREVGTMECVATIAAGTGSEELPLEVAWEDEDLPGSRTFLYRVVAGDAAGNFSAPSSAAVCRCFDESRPAPPVWEAPMAGEEPHELILSWSVAAADRNHLMERRELPAGAWTQLSSWLGPGVGRFVDASRLAERTYEYRLRVMDGRGRTNRDFHAVIA